MNTKGELRYNFAEAQKGVQPDDIKPYIGKILIGAWHTPDGMFFAFADNSIIQVSAAPVIAGGGRGLAIKMGESKPGTDWHAVLTPILGQDDPHLKMIEGLPFTGMDIDIFCFGSVFGVKIGVGQVEWVRSRMVPMGQSSI